MSAGPEEAGALVTVGSGARREPNAKAPEVELTQGLVAHGQNAYPNVRFDLERVNDLFGRFFSAGFYYKTFFGVRSGTADWMLFERAIRQAAGMGTASRKADPDAYEIVHDYCDLLVVGSGTAGRAAAQLAASEGLDVLMVERDFALGGGTLAEGQAVAATTGVRTLIRTTAFGLYDGNVIGLFERVVPDGAVPADGQPRARIRIVRPGAVILATGAIERPFAFADNDRPGVMLASAVGAYAGRYGVAVADRVALATNNDSTYGDAARLSAAGVDVTLLDARERAGEAATATAEARASRCSPKPCRCASRAPIIPVGWKSPASTAARRMSGRCGRSIAAQSGSRGAGRPRSTSCATAGSNRSGTTRWRAFSRASRRRASP